MHSLRVAEPFLPKAKTQLRERLRKPDTNLCKIMSLHNIFYEVAYVSVNVIEINNNIEVNSFSIFLGKFAIQRPSSNIYFALRVWEKVMSDL